MIPTSAFAIGYKAVGERMPLRQTKRQGYYTLPDEPQAFDLE